MKKIIALVTLVLAMPLLAESVPDFASFKDVKQKKKTFFDFIYERAVTENKAILKEREQLKSVKRDSVQMKKLCEKYSKNCDVIDQTKYDELLAKINVIPPSLVLAQAANESAWGTSRFAKKANNYFGQWCFTKGCGLVPARRNAGSSHEVRKFTNAQASVRSYLLNLNTGRAYTELRKVRSDLQQQGKTYNGIELAAGLSKYSERGEEYIKELRSMIRYNKLVAKYDVPFWQVMEK